MNISKDIKPITHLKSKAPDLLKQINETPRPVIITQNGEPRAALQDPESYENMRNAIGILRLISQGEQDVKDGKLKPQEEVFTAMDKLLKDKDEMKERYTVMWSETAERGHGNCPKTFNRWPCESCV
ncbi:MAG TPA: type II toxin-antitoxin system Phd/YefM family antitoxin [Deltaproteobacteria bacterium]|nr:type II toxin-antitoxin system Phd/YefM family antitoxin [Deltaproteobacteria bacterium]